MREKIVLHLLPPVLGISLLAVPPLAASSKSLQTKPGASQAQLPPGFEVNRGQTDPRVQFQSRGRGYGLFLMPTEAVLVLRKALGSRQRSTGKSEEGKEADPNLETHNSKLETVLRMKLLGANPHTKITGLDELPSRSNYFIGSDPNKWHTAIPSYAKVKYSDVYSGVDLVFYGNDRNLEFDFVIAPATDPSVIKLTFEGPDKLEIDGEGNLSLESGKEQILLRKPFIYQEIEGQKKEILGGYVFLETRNSKPETDLVTLQIADYDASRQLVIDPVLAYSTYVGGIASDIGNSIAVDLVGNVYVTGQTDSPDFPTANAIQPTISESGDAFVLKLDPTGALIYSTYFGGSGPDRGNSVAADSEGNAYITGRVGSDNLPITPGAPIPSFRGGMFDAFVAKLNIEGSELLYSTYLGGSGNDAGFGIAVDSNGNAYVTGGTLSDDFPITANALQPISGGSLDAFVTKLDPTGTALVYSTYLGGIFQDRANSIALDSEGNAYVAGHSQSTDFPTLNAYQANNAGGRDSFVTKLDPTGAALVYSTYLGGSSEDDALSIAVDGSGNAHVTGYTDSTDFPTANAYQPENAGSRDAFVTKLDAAGQVAYSTYLGGSSSENLLLEQGQGQTAGGIAVDGYGNAYVTGLTGSPDFPTQNPLQPSYGGGLQDAFVAKFNAEGALIYSTFLGGLDDDVGGSIAVDASGTVYVTGETRSNDFPTVNALQSALAGSSDAFIAVISDTNGGISTLSVSPTSVVPCDTVTVSWSGIPAPTSTDWIGLYQEGTDDFSLIDWIYVGCTQMPGDPQAGGSCLFIIPADLMPGSYELRLFSNDGFTRLAVSNPFIVTESIGTLSVRATNLSSVRQ